MNTIEITKMSLVEKLQTIDAIWDSLIHDNGDVKSPEWHGDILSTRKKKIEEGNAEFCSIEELRARSSR
jgi:putative addiction module component (TIGR02574 family)